MSTSEAAVNSKLVGEVEALLPNDEKVLGAFVGISGPRPGVEAFAVLAFGAVLVVTSSYWLALPTAVVIYVGVVVSRRTLSIALTDRNVVVVENTRRRHPRPNSVPVRLPVNAIQPPDVAAGDASITVGHVRYWVMGSSQDEARRLAKSATA